MYLSFCMNRLKKVIKDSWINQVKTLHEPMNLIHLPKRKKCSAARQVEKTWLTRSRFRFRFYKLTYDDVPDFLRDNEFIMSRYRPHMAWKEVLGSFFSIHNETGNIWSHFLFAILFLGFIIWFAIDGSPSVSMCSSNVSKWPGIMYAASIFINMNLSWWAHLTWPIGPPYSLNAWRFDYLGIITCIFGHYCTISFYLFQYGVWYMVAAGIGAITLTCFVWTEQFGSTAFPRVYRSVAFGIYGGSTIIPLLHSSIVYAHVTSSYFWWGQACLALDIALNMLGSVVFSMSFPERYFPHRFDVIGNSHNLMHICVASGFTSMAVGSWCWWQWRLADDTCI
jgi:predicted membrane channel-forming protein YqfA (hemolysin III family)